MSAYLALLRGINVSGNKRVPMAELRALAGELGWGGARTFIASGNLVFEAKGTTTALEGKLERALAKHFGFPVEVLVRSAADWRALVGANPLQALARKDPAHVLLALPKAALREEAAAELAERAQGAERVAAAGGALWIHYASGVARSKLTPALLDRCAGSTVTARNWRTVLELEAMLGEA
jgi:uncharacterized protein (DUF1697 family)